MHLVTTQIILVRADRSLGDSILQSGAALGWIVTPLIVLALVGDQSGGWRPPFTAIGCLGLLWIVPWLILIGPADLQRNINPDRPADRTPPPALGAALSCACSPS